MTIPDGTYVLGFKDEDEVDGQPVGPVFTAVMKRGFPMGEPRPFDPLRQPEKWYTLTQARAMAAERGVPLIEV